MLKKPLKILVVDDHPIFRQGMLQILKKNPLVGEIDEAEDGKEAIDKANRNLDYDIILLDISMPNIDGLKTLDYIQQVALKCLVVMVTSYSDEVYINRAFSHGAMGFILKDDVTGSLDECIRSVCQGKKYLSPSVQKSATENILDYKVTDDYDLSVLTDVERLVLCHTTHFKTKKEIARLLSTSPEVIGEYCQIICKKLDLKSIHQLSHLADILFPTKDSRR